MMKYLSNIAYMTVALVSFMLLSCQSEQPTYQGPNFIMFSSESHT